MQPLGRAHTLRACTAKRAVLAECPDPMPSLKARTEGTAEPAGAIAGAALAPLAQKGGVTPRHIGFHAVSIETVASMALQGCRSRKLRLPKVVASEAVASEAVASESSGFEKLWLRKAAASESSGFRKRSCLRSLKRHGVIVDWGIV